jgi:hypothetical protein
MLPPNLEEVTKKCIELAGPDFPTRPNPSFDEFVRLNQLYKSFFRGSSGHESQVEAYLETHFSDIFHRHISPSPKKPEKTSKVKTNPERKVSSQMFINQQVEEVIQKTP